MKYRVKIGFITFYAKKTALINKRNKHLIFINQSLIKTLCFLQRNKACINTTKLMRHNVATNTLDALKCDYRLQIIASGNLLSKPF